ncbi:MAG: transglycosylase SLT domain-containing protein [Candidatus Woesearchaeota archaeon]|nr:transglycosylase SLT domain-containing protein [Candidatus Woesearchaeota archaeon]
MARDYLKRNVGKDPELRTIYENTLRKERKKSDRRAKNAILAGLALATALSAISAFKKPYNETVAGDKISYSQKVEARAPENLPEKSGLDKILVEAKKWTDYNLNDDNVTIENKLSTAATSSKAGKSSEASLNSIDEIIGRITREIPKEKLEFYISNKNIVHMDEKYLPLIQKFADKIDIAKVAAIIEAESRWDTTCESGCGAYGLMQITQNSATKYEWKNKTNPELNISAGIRIWKAKESALKFCEPPEELKNSDSKAYYAAMWEHFKLTAAAYNGGQWPIIGAIEIAAKSNGKKYWKQTWADVQPYIEKACSQYYYYPGSKTEEIKGYVSKVTKYYSIYSTEFSIEKIAGSNAKIENIVSGLEKKIGENK